LLSVTTRNVDSPQAATPRVPTVPNASTAAAAISRTRIAVRPPGDSGGGEAGGAGGGTTGGAGGGGAMVVTVKSLSVDQDSR
jgi:hypothetical protein